MAALETQTRQRLDRGEVIINTEPVDGGDETISAA